MNNYTPRAQHVLSLAAKRAKEWGHSYVGSEHLMVGILDLSCGPVIDALKRLYVDLAVLRKTIIDGISADAQDTRATEVSTPPTPANPASPAAGKRAPEVRHYLLIDSSTQWFTKLARIEVEATWEPQKKGPSVYKETVVNEHLCDVPNDLRGDFLANIYTRHSTFTYRSDRENQSYHGWALSPAEHARIARMIELAPSAREFNRLAAYGV